MTNSQMVWMGVRRSKFRHVYGCAARRERCYDNINITRNAHDALFCAVNPKFIAVVSEVAGGGAFVVLPLERTGRVDLLSNRVTGHTGPVLDIKWNPFNDNIIASASEDCSVKVWYIPEGGVGGTNMTECLSDLRGHKRRVAYIEWHPTAENIIASAAYDFLIMLWETVKGEVVSVIDCHTDVIYSLSFNRDGSRLATTSKDKRLRIIDPRSGFVITEGECHTGARCSKACYLRGELVATVGFSRHCDRQLSLWSAESPISSGPIATETIDSSSGVLFPYFDHDTNVLFLAGKGDGNIRYYEISDSGFYFLNQYISGFPQKSLGFMPKRGLDVTKCEIFRFYKLHTTKPLCEPVSMIVPRKSDQFQDDLYPDTASAVPAMTAQQWLSGINKPPNLISIKSGVTLKTHKPLGASAAVAGTNVTAASERFHAKQAFLSAHTIADYRPLSQRDGSHLNSNLSINQNNTAAPDKVIKTTLNQNTKFQQLQNKFEKSIDFNKNESNHEKSNLKYIEIEAPKNEYQLWSMQ